MEKFSEKWLFFVILQLSCSLNQAEPAHSNACQGQRDGLLLSHPDRCEWFIECYTHIAYEKQCGKGLHFNPYMGICDYPASANCKKVQKNNYHKDDYTLNHYDYVGNQHYGQEQSRSTSRDSYLKPHYEPKSSYERQPYHNTIQDSPKSSVRPTYEETIYGVHARHMKFDLEGGQIAKQGLHAYGNGIHDSFDNRRYPSPVKYQHVKDPHYGNLNHDHNDGTPLIHNADHTNIHRTNDGHSEYNDQPRKLMHDNTYNEYTSDKELGLHSTFPNYPSMTDNHINTPLGNSDSDKTEYDNANPSFTPYDSFKANGYTNHDKEHAKNGINIQQSMKFSGVLNVPVNVPRLISHLHHSSKTNHANDNSILLTVSNDNNKNEYSREKREIRFGRPNYFSKKSWRNPRRFYRNGIYRQQQSDAMAPQMITYQQQVTPKPHVISYVPHVNPKPMVMQQPNPHSALSTSQYQPQQQNIMSYMPQTVTMPPDPQVTYVQNDPHMPTMTGYSKPEMMIPKPQIMNYNPPMMTMYKPPEMMVQNPQILNYSPPDIMVEKPQVMTYKPPEMVMQQPQVMNYQPPEMMMMQKPQVVSYNPPQMMMQKPHVVSYNPPQMMMQKPQVFSYQPPEMMIQKPQDMTYSKPDMMVAKPQVMTYTPPEMMVQNPQVMSYTQMLTNRPEEMVRKPQMMVYQPTMVMQKPQAPQPIQYMPADMTETNKKVKTAIDITKTQKGTIIDISHAGTSMNGYGNVNPKMTSNDDELQVRMMMGKKGSYNQDAKDYGYSNIMPTNKQYGFYKIGQQNSPKQSSLSSGPIPNVNTNRHIGSLRSTHRKVQGHSSFSEQRTRDMGRQTMPFLPRSYNNKNSNKHVFYGHRYSAKELPENGEKDRIQSEEVYNTVGSSSMINKNHVEHPEQRKYSNNEPWDHNMLQDNSNERPSMILPDHLFE